MQFLQQGVRSSAWASGLLLILLALCTAGLAQPAPSEPPPAPSGEGAVVPSTPVDENAVSGDVPSEKRTFFVLPNYKTVESVNEFRPLTSKQKFIIATKDSFDYPVIPVSGLFAGISYLQKSYPSFGNGAKGIAKYYGWAYIDQTIGNYVVEAIVPSMIHQDPRYFRRGTGNGLGRAGYAMTRVLLARSDNGKWGVNYSELVGTAASVGIGNAYYKDTRTWGDNASKFITFVATDSLSNLGKEFWPDIKNRFFKHHDKQQQP